MDEENSGNMNDCKDLILVDLRYNDHECIIDKFMSNFTLTDVKSRNMCYIKRNKQLRLRADDKKRRAFAAKAMRAIYKPNNTWVSMNEYQQDIFNIYSTLYKNNDTCTIIKPVLTEKEMILYN